MLGAAVRPREQRILSVERDGTDGAFDSVVVDLDAASLAFSSVRTFNRRASDTARRTWLSTNELDRRSKDH
jgi:hypothetical protein